MGRAEARRARQRGGGTRRAARGSSTTRSGIRRFFTWKKVLGTFFGLILLGMAGFLGLYLYVDVPPANAAAQLQSNVYKYKNGDLLARTGDVNREIIGKDRLDEKVRDTFVAAENKSFYNDPGVDFKGTARGLLNTMRGQGKQGGSTITQQYVKNYYLTQEQTVTRKLKELVISIKVDRKMSKDDILMGYINTSYYGRNAYGIQAAAQAYYGVDADRLNVQQGAYLAALLQAPNQYDYSQATPTSKKLVEERWNYVLDNMVEMDKLSQSERSAMKFAKPHDPKPAAGLKGQTGYLVDAANAELERQLVAQGMTPKEAAAKREAGGFTITLNIDKGKQKDLEKAVKKQLTDKLDPKERKVDAAVQAGAVSVDPKTGGIVALYGGEDYVKHYRSNATRDDYQPGSTFKPVILASALENGSKTQGKKPITANTIYDGTSGRPVKGGGGSYAPPNEGKKDYGDITVQEGMDNSVNSVFAQMGADVGMDKVKETASDLGMTDFAPHLAMTLGSMGASPLEMSGVYATFDNHGKKVTPSILKEVEHKDVSVDLPDPIGDEVISRGTADSVTSVLQGVASDGTGRVITQGKYAGAYEAAGKTGTSDSNVSALFAGYTPELVTVVGVYGEAPEGGGGLKTPAGKKATNGSHVSLMGAGGSEKVHGSGFPSQIWAEYTYGALNGGSDAKFDLDTDMGAGVAPPPTSAPPSSSAPPTSAPPTSAPPSSSAPPTSAPPTTGAPDPTDDPTFDPPTTQPPITIDPPEEDSSNNGRPNRD
ncbi:transglycosylase domain-containing protein [Streptomyces sp. NBC_01304]|uniref:transglycosylase domain-containing protein n=1 Tax=Streptomyces sp. NBC_01304 TaxID=2903818 RepID=UPI002E0E4F4A|nr:penicillin-binding protein [Streptomyces sp. NBC_01304]